MFSPLNLHIAFDHRITQVFIALLVSSVIVISSLSISIVWQVVTSLVTLLLSASLYYHWYLSVKSIREVRWLARQKLLFVRMAAESGAEGGGKWVQARCITARVCLPYCVYLGVELVNGACLSLVVTPRSVSSDGYRRLRTYVLHALPPEQLLNRGSASSN